MIKSSILLPVNNDLASISSCEGVCFKGKIDMQVNALNGIFIKAGEEACYVRVIITIHLYLLPIINILYHNIFNIIYFNIIV